MTLYTSTLPKRRKSKLTQANKIVKEVSELMTNNENVTVVQSKLENVLKLCDVATETHEELLSLPLPKEENDLQIAWFVAKMEGYNNAIKKVKQWLCDNNNDHDPQSVVPDDEIEPHDSVSNTSGSTSATSKSNQGLVILRLVLLELLLCR